MLEQTLDQRDKDIKEGKDPIARLMTLYLAGDEVPLLTELNAGFDTTKPLDQKLLKHLVQSIQYDLADSPDAALELGFDAVGDHRFSRARKTGEPENRRALMLKARARVAAENSGHIA